MGLRFLEYVKVDGKEVSLFIEKEPQEEDTVRFRVQVVGKDKYDFVLCKKIDSTWYIITQTRPLYILKKLYPLVTKAIEKNVEARKLYLVLN